VELGSEERRVLAAFADVYSPSEADARAALARVRARIDRGDVVEDAAEPPSRSRKWIAVGVVALAIAAAVVIALRMDLAAVLASEVEERDPEAAYAQPESSDAGGDAIDRPPPRREAPEVDPEPPSQVESAIEPAPEKPKRPRTSNKTARTPDATLHAEMALLRPAQQALKAGNHRRALQLFDDHARSFPKSALAEERALGRIEALCGLGRGDEARGAASTFVRRFPGSPYRAKAERACPR
jgi:type IV secretory pathway VirB10-like protein